MTVGDRMLFENLLFFPIRVVPERNGFGQAHEDWRKARNCQIQSVLQDALYCCHPTHPTGTLTIWINTSVKFIKKISFFHLCTKLEKETEVQFAFSAKEGRWSFCRAL